MKTQVPRHLPRSPFTKTGKTKRIQAVVVGGGESPTVRLEGVRRVPQEGGAAPDPRPEGIHVHEGPAPRRAGAVEGRGLGGQRPDAGREAGEGAAERGVFLLFLDATGGRGRGRAVPGPPVARVRVTVGLGVGLGIGLGRQGDGEERAEVEDLIVGAGVPYQPPVLAVPLHQGAGLFDHLGRLARRGQPAGRDQPAEAALFGRGGLGAGADLRSCDGLNIWRKNIRRILVSCDVTPRGK